MDKKKSEIFLWFGANWIWVGCVKHSLLLRENICHMGVNMLRNSLKILDFTKKKLLELISFQSNQNVWKKHCRADLSSLSDP